MKTLEKVTCEKCGHESDMVTQVQEATVFSKVSLDGTYEGRPEIDGHEIKGYACVACGADFGTNASAEIDSKVDG